MSKSVPTTYEKQLTFEKERFEYCEKIYGKELERKDNLEKRVQFYLSLVTLILGGVFFNIEFFNTLKSLISNNSTYIFTVSLIYVFLGISTLAILISIISVLQAMEIKNYTTAYPSNFISSIFSPESTFYEKQDTLHLLKATATSYAIALEINRDINDSKAYWLKVSSFSIFTVAISLAMTLVLVTYLLLQH